jgi:hypothetical protein
VNSKRLTTAEFAEIFGVQPHTVRVHLWRHGHYAGIQPLRAPNHRLLWPSDSEQRYEKMLSSAQASNQRIPSAMPVDAADQSGGAVAAAHDVGVK